MKQKRKVLVVLGWNDPRTLLALARHARDADWHLETRHFYTETVPEGWRGDGLIVSNPQRPDLRRYILRQAPRQSTVLLGGNNPGVRAPQVVEDNRAAGRLVARHLLERGHKHFAWLGVLDGPVVTDRREGYEAALASAGHNVHSIAYPAGDWARRRAGLGRQLRALPRPLALLTLDDQLAAEAIEVCLEAGLRVPEDIAVAGIGNIELACETSHVPITSVDLASETMAEVAAKLLDRLMRGKKPPAKPIVVPTAGLVVRRSTAALAATQPAVVRATQHIAAHLAQPLDMDALAAAAGVSRRSLYNLFAAELARTPADYLRDERLAEARRRLAGSDSPIAEIAAACGFGTVRTMNRVFLTAEGTAPRTWRQRAAALNSKSEIRNPKQIRNSNP